MLAHSRVHRQARRGIVLVLVLAMLGLLALIGVTFATQSGQARINGRNFFQSVLRPQRDVLLDFALSQLITDTGDIRSAIRGHSLARDMYGNDANHNGYLDFNPATGGALFIQDFQQVPGSGNALQYDIQTYLPVPANAPALYGYDFTHWTLRLSYTGPVAAGAARPVTQTFEILVDDHGQIPPNAGTQFNGKGFFSFRVTPVDTAGRLSNTPPMQTSFSPVLHNDPRPHNLPALRLPATTAPLAGKLWPALQPGGVDLQAYPFVLDGRWLRAFNGSGVGALARYGNFRFNGGIQAGNPAVASPGILLGVGMDEDYDACDLENWFLAIQSADGQVMIPSFHRPGILRYDPTHGVSDWQSALPDSMARILRPRAFDGHDSFTFPDLVPGANGKIPWDVDNDGDGEPDSVWVDLGYPARRDSRGQLYKPLFAFMVIGLNGRIPLNTAGNLAGGGSTHAQHLGNSVSEVDPTYALQNAYTGDVDPFNVVGTGAWPPAGTPNTQVDNSANLGAGGMDVRLTQLRNLLAGTRPQKTPTTLNSNLYPPVADPGGTLNGDDNNVYGSWPGVGAGRPYFMPNGIADAVDRPQPAAFTYTDPQGNVHPLIRRLTDPVAGRWGEAASVPGMPFTNPGGGPPLNLVQDNYTNPIRAGYSFDVADLHNHLNYDPSTPFPRDAADDNYNSFDPVPLVATGIRTGEVGDLDYYDPPGALILPIERMRRFVTPIDINGTGNLARWRTNVTPGRLARDASAADNFGRVFFGSYFRPPGVAGSINTTTSWTAPQPGSFANGSIAFADWANGLPTYWTVGAPYQPDVTNNPLHGYESARLPNLLQNPGSTFNAANPPSLDPRYLGGMPIDQNRLDAAYMNDPAHGKATGVPATYTIDYPTFFPTYDAQISSSLSSDGLNEADEMNLYAPNPLLDSPYGPSDLEWLYRQQDVDGKSLNSRLSRLAPISFSNTLDGQRRRRLVALESWEPNNFVWANDDPLGAFANNRRFAPGVSTRLPVPTPALAHRDRKINLNLPLPVSNDPDELVRKKWISDTYQFVKWVLPPDAVDTAEELAQLSQFVINIIDFRDPDGTMTHWINPDVLLGIGPLGNPILTLTNLGNGNLDQYGMEYHPVALNEALAYSFLSRSTAASGGLAQNNRFFIELVNTLTAAYNANYNYGTPTDAGNYYNNASVLDLGGFSNTPTTGDPYGNGCWDLVLSDDTPQSRPDPFRGELFYNANIYTMIPLNRDAFGGTIPGAPNGGDLTLIPINPAAATPTNYAPDLPTTPPPGAPPITYYHVIGSPTSASTEVNALTTNTNAPRAPAVTRSLDPRFDPVGNPGTAIKPNPGVLFRQGILPVAPGAQPPAAFPTSLTWKLPDLPQAKGDGTGTGPAARFFWVYLRRPANPFAPVSASNPMCVVDAMRVPYIDGTGSLFSDSVQDGNGEYCTQGPYNTIYSAQRLQPYRGGHAVPATTITPLPLDPRYGYSEQTAVPVPFPANFLGTLNTYGIYNQYTQNGQTYTNPATNVIVHTLGQANASAENWDHLVFHDRDFSSVAELLLVPGCPPGLFTKQFCEFAPSLSNVAGIFTAVTPVLTPKYSSAGAASPTGGPNAQGGNFPRPADPFLSPFATATVPFLMVSNNTVRANSPTGASPTLASASAGVGGLNAYPQPTPTTDATVQPHTYPYLVDRFFYTGASTFYYPPTGGNTDPGGVVGGAAGDGWFKMFEFFEVPSQMIGSIGPVAQGANFDWARQDSKPGLLNLNLIIDEEAFFSVFGDQDSTSFVQNLLNSTQLPYLAPGLYALPLTAPAQNGLPPIPINNSPVPLVVTAVQVNGAPSYVYPVTNQGSLDYDPLQQSVNNFPTGPPPVGNRLKAAFAQFLWLRHGGSGYLFGYGEGDTGENTAVMTQAGQLNTGRIPAERPFRSLSFPDINFTVMRPAALPPSIHSNPPVPSKYADPAVTVPTNDPAINAGLLYDGGYYGPFLTTNTKLVGGSPVVYTGDPGVRNSLLYPGYLTTNPPIPSPVQYPAAGGTPSGVKNVAVPPPIPAARLFQPPDAYGAKGILQSGYTGTGNVPPALSNATDSGDPWINNQVPNLPTQATAQTVFTVNNGFTGLVWSGGDPYVAGTGTPPVPATGALPPVQPPGAPATASPLFFPANPTNPPPKSLNPYLGSATTGTNTDDRQHPYWRSELLQKAMNLTTVRTHQYAVWVTVGFFEVKRQGDIGMSDSAFPQLAYDTLGPELGAVTGKNERFRAFFLVDRTKLTGFDPGNVGSFRSAVAYRKVIQ